MARLLTMKAAWLMDTVGNKHARMEISAIHKRTIARDELRRHAQQSLSAATG